MIQTRLNNYALRHPELSPIVAALPDSLEITSHFVSVYFKSDASSLKKNTILRILFGDPRVVGGSEEKFSIEHLTRIIQFFEYHPAQPLSPLSQKIKKDIIPKPLEYLFELDRQCPNQFFSELVLQPYIDWRNGNIPDLFSRTGLQGESAAFLRTHYERRVLDEGNARSMLTEQLSTHSVNWFFDTGVKWLDLRNALMYCTTLLTSDRQHGRIQNKLPMKVSDLFGIARLSIPDLSLFLDILSLAALGITDPVRRNKDRVLENLLAMFDRNVWTDDLQILLKELSVQWLMSPSKAQQLYQKWEKLEKIGRYESSLHFNVSRLLDHPDAIGAMRRFLPYYGKISTSKLLEQIQSHYQQISPAFAEWLEQAIELCPDEFTGIHARDLASTLYYTWWNEHEGHDPGPVLPPVARYTLGATEYPATGNKGSYGPHRDPMTGEERIKKIHRLPLLEEIQASAPMH